MFSPLKKLLGIKRSIPYEWVESSLLERCNSRILSGPFKGMQSLTRHVGCRAAPRLLGIYEKELQPWLESLVGNPFDLFVDVGAAEGYYAIGVALRSSIPSIIAFETEASGQEEIRTCSGLNGVADRIEVRGKCEPEELAGCLAKGEHPWVMVDIEGAEGLLLDPKAVPGLEKCTILVELHEQYVPGVGAELKARFKETHFIEEVCTAARTVGDLPFPAPFLFRTLLKKWLLMVIADGRGDTPMSWLLMRPRPVR